MEQHYIKPRILFTYLGSCCPTTLSIIDAIRLIGDPILTCHLQPLSDRRAVGDLSLFYRSSLEYCSHIWRAAAPTTLSILDTIRLIGDLTLTCHLKPLSHRRAVGDFSLYYGIQSDSAPPS
nr:unnamed protein product [Callosobruchus chinensis]